MDKEIEELKQYLQGVSDFAFPEYKELPNIELYMEQVLKYINTTLPVFENQSEDDIVAFTERNRHKVTCINE